MNLDEALRSLGVTSDTLRNEQKAFLGENGYLLLRDLMPPDEMAPFANRLDELAVAEVEAVSLGKSQPLLLR